MPTDDDVDHIEKKMFSSPTGWKTFRTKLEIWMKICQSILSWGLFEQGMCNTDHTKGTTQ